MRQMSKLTTQCTRGRLRWNEEGGYKEEKSHYKGERENQ